MSEAFGFIFGVSVLAGGFFVCYHYLLPHFRVLQYLSWYKIGRIKQFCKDKNIDLDKIVFEDALLMFKQDKSFKHLQNTWSQKIIDKINDELEEINKEDLGIELKEDGD